MRGVRQGRASGSRIQTDEFRIQTDELENRTRGSVSE